MGYVGTGDPARRDRGRRNWPFVRHLERRAGYPGSRPVSHRSSEGRPASGHGRTPRKRTVQRRLNPVGATTARSGEFRRFHHCAIFGAANLFIQGAEHRHRPADTHGGIQYGSRARGTSGNRQAHSELRRPTSRGTDNDSTLVLARGQSATLRSDPYAVPVLPVANDRQPLAVRRVGPGEARRPGAAVGFLSHRSRGSDCCQARQL